MRKSGFIGKFATIVLLLVFVVNVTILVHDVIASAYVKTVTSTGTEYSQDGFDVWGFIKIPTLQAFAEASATPTAPWRSATPGPYSGWARVSATAGNQEKEDSGVIWIHINQDGRVDSSSGGYYVKVTHSDENASTSAYASGYLYGP